MELDELEVVAANLRVLVKAELQAQHQMGYHRAPAEGCPVCRARAS